ncbi:MAG: hypothetical protein IIB33_00715, partial [Chloroflexi bacterium]|nr:hypothetical protein [Chloroflexota bacterium]
MVKPAGALREDVVAKGAIAELVAEGAKLKSLMEELESLLVVTFAEVAKDVFEKIR